MLPDEFWGLTLSEIILWISQRRKSRSDIAMIQAWKTALWQRCPKKSFPNSMKDVLGRDPDEEAPTPQNVAHKIMNAFKAMAGK